MKNVFKLLTLMLCVLIFTSQVYAQDALKIGAAQLLKVLKQSPQYQAAGKSLEKEFEPRKKTLIAAQKKIKELQDKLARDRAIMSKAEINKMEKDILTKQRDYKRDQDEFREDINFRNNEELAKVQKVVYEAIQKVAKDNQYDIVLTEGVIYASPKADITQLVIDALNSK